MSEPANGERAKYLDVAAALEEQIRSGKWDGEKMPSVRGVARQHGVSVVTASRAIQVLRDKGLIQTIARSGCYRIPPPSAECWALLLRLTPGPWQKATRGISRQGFEALARREPIRLETDPFSFTVQTTEREILTSVRRAKEQGVGGVFLLPSRHSDEEMRLDERFLACCAAERLPVVLLERNLRGHNRPLQHDLVAVDDLDGAARCTRHLLELGRKRVAIIVASPTSSHNDRVAGYLYALHTTAQATRRKHADQYRPIVLYQREEPPSSEGYARLAEEILKQGIDGVVCYQDYTAIGVILELLKRGIAIPEQVAVVGFDDLPIGYAFSIGVTTYAYPSEGIAEQALRLMRERVKHPDRPPIKVVVPGHLIVRASTVGSRNVR